MKRAFHTPPPVAAIQSEMPAIVIWSGLAATAAVASAALVAFAILMVIL